MHAILSRDHHARTGGRKVRLRVSGPAARSCQRENPMAKTRKIGRSAVSGKFTSVKKAKAKPRVHVVETIKVGKVKKGK